MVGSTRKDEAELAAACACAVELDVAPERAGGTLREREADASAAARAVASLVDAVEAVEDSPLVLVLRSTRADRKTPGLRRCGMSIDACANISDPAQASVHPQARTYKIEHREPRARTPDVARSA